MAMPLSRSLSGAPRSQRAARGVVHRRVAAVLACLAHVLDERSGEHGGQDGDPAPVYPDLAVVRGTGQADKAPGLPGRPHVVLDPALARPVEVPVIDLVALGEQDLDHGPVQVEPDLDVALDAGRAQVDDERAGPGLDLELVRAGPVAQALGHA